MATALEQQLEQTQKHLDNAINAFSAADLERVRAQQALEAKFGLEATYSTFQPPTDPLDPLWHDWRTLKDDYDAKKAQADSLKAVADTIFADVRELNKKIAEEREKAAKTAANAAAANSAPAKFKVPTEMTAFAEEKKRQAYNERIRGTEFSASNFKGGSGHTSLENHVDYAFKSPTGDDFRVSEQPDPAEPDTRVTGSGGEASFWIMPLKMDGTPDDRVGKAVRFDLLPARHSYFDRQGQKIPDAGAGMQFNLLFNLAKLNIPGARPVYQQMGISEEHIEMVGAFTGFDLMSYEETAASTYRNVPGRNAWKQAQELIELITQGREFMIKITTDDPNDGHFQVLRASGESYRGFAKICRMILAHEQRVYWKLVVCVTNRDGDGHLDFAPYIKVPKELSQGVGGRLAGAKTEAATPTTAPATPTPPTGPGMKAQLAYEADQLERELKQAEQIGDQRKAAMLRTQIQNKRRQQHTTADVPTPKPTQGTIPPAPGQRRVDTRKAPKPVPKPAPSQPPR